MNLMTRTTALAAALTTGFLILGNGKANAQLPDQTQVSPTNDLPNPYERIHPWGELPHPYEEGAYDNRAAFIGVDEGPDGNIYLLSRCIQNSCTGRSEAPILKLSRSGQLLSTWGAGLFDFPHGMDVDDEGNVWTADQRGHQVLKFDPEGELLMTIGEKGRAGEPPLLDEPTDVVVAPSGEVFITEGHSFANGANRVSKYTADGTFIMQWGGTGSGAGQFNVPHTIALDSGGRVFVGDRANNRIQIFDQAGAVLDVWYQFGRPSGIAIGADDRIYVADSESFGTDNPGWRKGIRVGHVSDGSVEYLITDLESTAIEHSGAEGVGVDAQGNVYGAVVRRRMLEKFSPEPTSANSASDSPVASPATDATLTHLGHVTLRFAGSPDGRGLAATVSAESGTALLHANFAAGNLSDLGAMQTHAGHVLHLLDPAERATGPGLGMGVIPAITAMRNHLELAANTTSASENMRAHTAHVTAIADGILANARGAVNTAHALQAAVSIRRAAPLIAHLRLLLYQITEGRDADDNDRISFDGEAGMQQLEEHLYLLLEGEGLARELR